MKVTKHDIVTALRTEPLTANAWVKQTVNGCKTCAVGAVVRRAGVSIDGVSLGVTCRQLTEYRNNYNSVAPKGNWLSALSIVWEYLNKYNDGSPESFRPDIIRWAEDHIPETYTVEIPT